MKNKFVSILSQNGFVISIVSLIASTFLIDYYYAYYSLIVVGEQPIVGISGIPLIVLFFILSLTIYKKIDKYLLRKNRAKGKFDMILAILTIVFPGVLIYLYCELYYIYADHLEKKILNESFVSVGEIYSIKAGSGRSPSYKLKIGVDNKHIRKNKIETKNYSAIKNSKGYDLQKGDKIILRVSDEYPRVMEVLKWNPTKEEIERYKTPRKFKSCINGKIYDEEE